MGHGMGHGMGNVGRLRFGKPHQPGFSTGRASHWDPTTCMQLPFCMQQLQQRLLYRRVSQSVNGVLYEVSSRLWRVENQEPPMMCIHSFLFNYKLRQILVATFRLLWPWQSKHGKNWQNICKQNMETPHYVSPWSEHSNWLHQKGRLQLAAVAATSALGSMLHGWMGPRQSLSLSLNLLLAGVHLES